MQYCRDQMIIIFTFVNMNIMDAILELWQLHKYYCVLNRISCKMLVSSLCCDLRSVELFALHMDPLMARSAMTRVCRSQPTRVGAGWNAVCTSF